MIHNKGINPQDICSRQFSSFDEASIWEKHILSITEAPLNEDEQRFHTSFENNKLEAAFQKKFNNSESFE